MKNWYIYLFLVVAIVVLLVLVRGNGGTNREERVTRFDNFAQCLSDAGAIFYGAFWCPHCKDQKEMFENSSKLPYVECSTPDAQGQLKRCIDEGVDGYPYWKFPDGTVIEGVASFEQLGEKTGCEVPA